MAVNFYPAIGLTGGAAGALDAIDGAGLVDGDRALVVTTTAAYLFQLSGSSGAAESSPDVISPDSNAGTKRWLLVKVVGNTGSPTTNTDGSIPQWNGANTGMLKDGLAVVTTVGDPGVDTSIPTDQAVREAIDAIPASSGTDEFNRSKFVWKDADEVYIGGGKYLHIGTSTQWVYWNSILTKQLTTAAGVEDFWYLYLDDSAIVTAGVALLTAVEFIWSTTAPTWDETKKGYYNSLDRCIFAVRVDAANAIERFWHDGGDYVAEDKYNSVYGPTDVDQTFLDVTFNLPSFAEQVNASFVSNFVTASGGSTAYRPNGSAATTGQVVGSATAAGQNVNSHAVQVVSGVGEVKMTSASDSTVIVIQNGWYLPRGM